MPVFNEGTHLVRTMEALATAIDGSGFDAELVLVDDGSTDGSADVARSTVDGRFPLRVVTQSNRGRFEARRAGLSAGRGDYVLFLDARVQLVEAKEIFHVEMEATNTREAPDTVVPRHHGESRAAEGKLRARLKPGSWNVFVLQHAGT